MHQKNKILLKSYKYSTQWNQCRNQIGVHTIELTNATKQVKELTQRTESTRPPKLRMSHQGFQQMVGRTELYVFYESLQSQPSQLQRNNLCSPDNNFIYICMILCTLVWLYSHFYDFMHTFMTLWTFQSCN